MTRNLKNAAITGLSALLAACGTTAQPPTTPAPTSLPTPKWFEGGLELTLDADQTLEAAEDTTLTYADADGEQRTAYLTFNGAQTPRTIATLDGQPISNDATHERVTLENGGFYDDVSVGTDVNAVDARYTPAELGDVVSDVVADHLGENMIYAVLSKDESGNYNAFHSSGVLSPDTAYDALSELEECASAPLATLGVRVLPGQFDASGTTYGAVIAAYDDEGACAAHLLIGNDADIGPIADRASKIAYDIAPDAAAAAYLDPN